MMYDDLYRFTTEIMAENAQEESECNCKMSAWYLILYPWGKFIGLKRQLQSLKRELKGWEAMFERKHGHKPSKVCL